MWGFFFTFHTFAHLMYWYTRLQVRTLQPKEKREERSSEVKRKPEISDQKSQYHFPLVSEQASFLKTLQKFTQASSIHGLQVSEKRTKLSLPHQEAFKINFSLQYITEAGANLTCSRVLWLILVLTAADIGMYWSLQVRLILRIVFNNGRGKIWQRRETIMKKRTQMKKSMWNDFLDHIGI